MFRSIKTKILICLLSLVFIASLVLGLAGYYMMINHLKAAHRENLEYIANLEAVGVKNYFSSKIDLMERLSQGREIADYFEKLRDLSLIRFFTKFANEFPILSYINEEGVEEVKVVNGEISEEYRDIGETFLFQDAIWAPNKVIISSIEQSPELGVPVIRLILAKYTYFGDRFIGALSGTIPLSVFTGRISKTKVGKTGFVSLIDKDGNILFYPQKDKILTKIIGEGKEAEALISNSTALRTGFTRATLLGLDGFVAYAPVKDRELSIIVTMPYEEFIAAPNVLRNTTFVIFLVVFIGSIFTSIIMVGGITKPILKLATVTELIAKGDLTQRADIQTKDEIGYLAVSFNKMVGDLSVSMQKEKELAASAAAAEAEKKRADELHAEIKERKRMKKLLHRKTELINLIHTITIAANEVSTVDEAMQICLDNICSYAGWPIGHVYLPQSAKKLTSSQIWYLESPKKFKTFREATETTSFDIGVGLPGCVLASGEPIWITDVTKEPRLLRTKFAKDINVKAGFAFPVLEGKKVVAVLEFFSEETIEPDLSLLEAISNLATQLGRVTERKRAEIAHKQFSKKLVVSQESERKRIASEIHDGLGQNILVIKSGIRKCLKSLSGDGKVADTLNQISLITQQSVDEVREIISNLHPHQLEQLGLKGAIESAITQAAQSSNIKFLSNIQDIDDLLPKDIEIHVYRIVQEGISNMVKHSGATKSKIHIGKTENFMKIKIKDNGKGFIFNSDSIPDSGFGLAGISERVKMLGGNFKVDSLNGQGTVLTIKIPLIEKLLEKRENN